MEDFLPEEGQQAQDPVPSSAIERMKQKIRARGGLPRDSQPTQDETGGNIVPSASKSGDVKGSVKLQPTDISPGPATDKGVSKEGGKSSETGQTRKRREGIADNPIEDAVHLANELFTGVIDLGKIAYEDITNPSEYWTNVKHFFGNRAGKASDVMGVLWDSVTENYKDDEGQVNFKDAITKRPFHTAADLAAIVSVAGGVTKTAAKMAGGVSRLGLTAEVAAKLPKVLSTADKVMRVGEAIEKVANTIDPVMLTAKGLKVGAVKSGAVKALADWTGIGEHTKPILAMEANEFASEMQKAARDKAELAFRHLPPDEGDKLRRAMMRGAPEDIAALSPAGKEWLDRFTRQVTGPGGQELSLEARQVGLTPERRMGALAKGAALETYGPSYTKEQLAEVAAKVNSGEWKPVYATLFEPEKTGSLIDTLTADYQRSRRYGRLEERMARGAYEKDPYKIAMRQIDAYHDTTAKLRSMDRTISYLQQRGLAKSIRSMKELPDGWAVVETPILKRYFEVKNRAGALLVDNIMAGKNTEQAMRDVQAAIFKDPKLVGEIASASHIAVPKYVARLIDLRYGSRTGLGIVYEKLMSYWKSAAVLWRPSAWIGAATGNSFLALLHGVGPEDVIRSRRLKDLLPPEIGSVVQLDHYVEPGASAFSRVNRTLGEYYQDLDSALLRGPAFFKEVEQARRETHAALKQVGAEFFAAVDAVDDANKWAAIVAASPEKLSEAQQNILRIQERIAENVPEIAKLQGEHLRLAERIQKMEAATADALNSALGSKPTYRTKQLAERLTKLEQDAEALRAQVTPTMEAAKAARATVKRGPEAIQQEIEETLEKLKLPNSEADQIRLEATMRRLEEEKKALQASGEVLHKEGVQAKRTLRKGRSGLTRQLAQALAEEERAAAKFHVGVLQDIRERGGIKRVPGITNEIPEGLLGTKGGGVHWDELAQELYDRGHIGDPSIDALADFLHLSRSVVASSREAVKNALSRARVLAKGKVEDAIRALTENVRERAKIQQELSSIGRQERAAGKAAIESTITTEAKPIAREQFRNALKDLEEMSKKSATIRETMKDFKTRITQTRRKLTAEEQRVLGKAAEMRRELDEAVQSAGALESRIKQMKADMMERLVNAGKIKQTVPELEQLQKFADRAIEAGNRLGGGYARLHPIERRYFRTLVPFYAYMKTMTMLVARLPFLYPKRTFLWNRWAQLSADLARGEETPEYLDEWYPVAHSQKDGGTFFMKLSNLKPWGGVRSADFGVGPVPSIMDVVSANPVIKMVYEFNGGVPRWSKRPISPGEGATRMDNGEVWKVNPDGTVKKILATPSIWRALWNLFPQSQLIESLFVNAAQTDRGWLLDQDPIIGPDGKPMFPRDLMQRITSFLGPTVMKKNLDEELSKERARKLRIAQSFMKDARTMPPEKREAQIETLKSYLENLDRPTRRLVK